MTYKKSIKMANDALLGKCLRNDKKPCKSCEYHVARLLLEANKSLDGFLGPKHTGMKVQAPGLIGRISDGWEVDKGQRYVAGEFLKHLEKMAKRFYAGDAKAVDEFLQLYCLDKLRPQTEESNKF